MRVDLYTPISLRVAKQTEYDSSRGKVMFIYTIHPMPGQKAKVEGDTSIKYRIKRIDDSLAAGKKGRSEIIRDNLEYDEAVRLIDGFNNMEGKSQGMREEAARQENKL